MLKNFAIWAAKAAILFSKLLGKKGSSGPGGIALRICPDLLERLSRGISGEIVAVLGTNGKTTTNNMLTDLLEADGRRVVTNRVGANMLHGVVTAFADAASWTGRLRCDGAALEIDEASAQHVFRHLKPHKIIITNLFRDQLDRYGEIDLTAGFIHKALDLAPEAMLILNGDDPLAAQFGKRTKHVRYFGVSEDLGLARNETKEGRFCALCGEKLQYEYFHYSQLGKYACPACGFCRPEPDFDARDVKFEDGLAFTLHYEGKTLPVSVPYRGFYNVYNILAALSAALSMGAHPGLIDKTLKEYRPQIGRMESFALKKPTVLSLSKNPAGMNQAITTVLQDKTRKNVMIMLNDGAQDGKDISWIWDVDFERLLAEDISTFVLSGSRKEDVAVRLKYAGVPRERMTLLSDPQEAILKTLEGDGEICYLLVNYTALFGTQNLLKKMEEREGK